MAEEIRKVDYSYVFCPDKPGEAGKILSLFREAGVNLLAAHAFPQARRSQLDIVPEDPATFLKIARKAKLKPSKKKTAFRARGDDQVGVMANLFEKLGQANINVIASTAIGAGKGRFGAIFWVKPSDIRKAARALGI